MEFHHQPIIFFFVCVCVYVRMDVKHVDLSICDGQCPGMFAFVCLQSCDPTCIIHIYSRFPSANDESLKRLRFVSVEKLPAAFIPHSLDCLFLPVASIDLITCTFVAFLGLVLCILLCGQFELVNCKRNKSITVYQNGILRKLFIKLIYCTV